MSNHDERVAKAFDAQAARFEKAPVQTDPGVLAWFVDAARLPPDSFILDAGCGPGIVSEALLAAGHRVVGVDLSAEMIERARRRCDRFGTRGRFQQGSVFDSGLSGPIDAALSRLVLHHVPDPHAFVRRQVELLRPGGVLILCDHTTDADPARAAWHHEIEMDRDQTHTRNLSPGQLIDVVVRAGLVDLQLSERPFALDFDEWFDRGSPQSAKAIVRGKLIAGHGCRGFQPEAAPDGSIRIQGWLAIVRGVRRQLDEKTHESRE